MISPVLRSTHALLLSVDAVADAITRIRSSGLPLGIVVQSKSQPPLAFGEDGLRNLFSNMGVEIAAGSLDQEQAEEINQRITGHVDRWPLAIGLALERAIAHKPPALGFGRGTCAGQGQAL
jgi:TraM recognition site of TraD and TraG